MSMSETENSIFNEYPVLENDYIILKKMRLEDAPSLDQMKSDKDVYRFLPTFLPELQSENSETFARTDCDRLLHDQEGILLGIYLKADPDRLAGIAEMYDYAPERSKISIGFRLRKEYWHKHIATNTVALLKAYILEEAGLKRITAHVIVENHGSIRCLLNNGFVQRRLPHEEDWGHAAPVIANKYVIYPADDPEPIYSDFRKKCF